MLHQSKKVIGSNASWRLSAWGLHVCPKTWSGFPLGTLVSSQSEDITSQVNCVSGAKFAMDVRKIKHGE